MKKVLVTGGAGFIGSHLVEALLARGRSVTVVDDESTGRPENLSAARSHASFRYLRGDAGAAALLGPLVAEADEVYHLAAAVGVQLIASKPLESIERNLIPTRVLLGEVLRTAAHRSPPRVFIASSSEVYGKNSKERFAEDDDLVFGPTIRSRWSYGAAKAMDEFMALACHAQAAIPIVIGRFFNVVGPRQSGEYGMVLPRFVAAARAGAPLVVHDDGAQVRCFAHVADVVEMVLRLMETPAAAGRVVNIGSDEAVSILELARRVIAASGGRARVAFQSYAAAYDADFEDVRRRVPDLSRFRSLVAFQPQYRLDDIIRQLLEQSPKA